MARYVMVLRSATSLRGALEGVGPLPTAVQCTGDSHPHHETETFLGPDMARAKRVPFGSKKVDIQQGHIKYVAVIVPMVRSQL
jgi:hypothetical protein